MMTPRAAYEEVQIRRAIENHSTLLLRGPSQVSIRRSVNAVLNLELGNTSSPEAESAKKGNHPDLLLIDGRELKAPEARELRSFVTTFPARWNKRYMLLSHMNRPHYTVIPVLLKVVEEPPAHFCFVMMVDNLRNIPDTIPSRAINLTINIPDKEEITDILKKADCSEPAWRASHCGGDPEVGQEMDLTPVKNWTKMWTGIVSGGEPLPNLIPIWGEVFQAANEATSLALWENLIKVSTRKVYQSTYWREVGLLAMENRNRTRAGRQNKLHNLESLTRIYALTLTSSKRGR